jgi:hypothetical protein
VFDAVFPTRDSRATRRIHTRVVGDDMVGAGKKMAAMTGYGARTAGTRRGSSCGVGDAYDLCWIGRRNGPALASCGVPLST